ncbi:MAG: PilW family protein [Methylomonas sp.]|nr:PilW family protein [Methylomonas sp.]
MHLNKLIQSARAKRQAAVISSLQQRFAVFPYPVYLFGSFASGQFHGYSDIDIMILAPRERTKEAYAQACDTLSDWETPYDILVCQSVAELDDTIKSSLYPLHRPRQTASNGLHQQGMTLIEILIAMLLGIFLLAGVLQIFLNTKQTYRMQEGLSRLQENGRFAMEFISQDVRMAGFFGCLSNNFSMANVENELDDQTDFAWDISNPLMGYNDVTNAFTVISNVVVGTDVIAMRGLFGDSIPLIAPYSDSAQMFVDPAFNADCPSGSATTCHEGEILMVTDCTQGTIFQATNTTDIGGGSGVNVVHSVNNTFTPGNTAPATFTKSYGPGAQIARLKTYAYYIRLNPGNQPALYRSELTTSGNATNAMSAQELIEGIEDMQITYGVDTDADGTPNSYLTANNIIAANWPLVVSVRISLLARTIADNLSASAVPYDYNGADDITPADRRLRRAFTTTIALRNRLR